MIKTDFKKELRELFGPPTKDFVLVRVPQLAFLMVDGVGDPNTAQSYAEAVEALYSVSYALKFASKKELEHDYVVPPLEGLWWADDPAAFVKREKNEWRWTMMIMQPNWITEGMATAAIETSARNKELPALPGLRFDGLLEGLSLQIMHIGSFESEGPTLARLHSEYMPAHGFTFNGPHHEIYLGDPRKTAPEKLKTILRQPVKEL
ncbi:MAG TPA: GyrI-like domain-containing protein [Acidimicrobiia bacterium]|nr:GyrI-like domain-containing protein [Acidimicrobiia bacterium]